MSQQNPASINSLSEKVLEKILLQLRTPKTPQFWLLRGVNQRWLSIVRRHSNFRAEIQSHNLRTFERDGDTAYLFHLAETRDDWKTKSELLSAIRLDNTTFFGRISECNVQIMRECAFALSTGIVDCVEVLTDRLCLHDANMPLSLQVALDHSNTARKNASRVSDHINLEFPTSTKKLAPIGLSFVALFGDEAFTVTQTVHFFEWMASIGALQSLTSLSLFPVRSVDAKTALDLTPDAILSSGVSFRDEQERFYNMLRDTFRSDGLKTLRTLIASLDEVWQLADRFPNVEELTLYGRGYDIEFDFSSLQAFASLKRLHLYVKFDVIPWLARKSWGGLNCCDGMEDLPSVALPSLISLTVGRSEFCSHGLTKALQLGPSISKLTLSGMYVKTVNEALKSFLPKQPLASLQHLVLKNLQICPVFDVSEVEGILRTLSAIESRLPALQHVRISVPTKRTDTDVHTRRDFGLFEALPTSVRRLELGNVFSPAVQNPAKVTPGCAMEWLRDLIDQFLRTQLDSALISVLRSSKVLQSHFAEFRSRFADQPDQFGNTNFQNGWRYLGEAKWEIQRDLGEPNALACLLEFDREKRLLKFRLISGEDDKVVKYLDLYIAPKALLPS